MPTVGYTIIQPGNLLYILIQGLRNRG